MEERILDLGIEVILLLQQAGTWLLAPMGIFSFMGNPIFYFLVLTGLYWSLNSKAGLRVGLIVMLSGAFNYFFKIGLHSPRPYWYDPRVQALSHESSFGIPSGHAQTAVVLWGILAASSRWRRAWAGAIVLIFLISLSRMYLGVHFPHDVFAGWLLGAILLGGFIAIEASQASRLKRLPAKWQISFGIIISLGIIASGFLVRTAMSGWTLPEVWVQAAAQAAPDANPIDPLNLAELISGSGAFLGLLGGAVWMATRGGFSTGGSWQVRVLRFLVGLTGAAVLYSLPPLLMRDASPALDLIIQYLHFVVVGFWITGLAPAVFIRLGLAGPERSPAVRLRRNGNYRQRT